MRRLSSALLGGLLLCSVASAEIMDRIAVAVGTRAIKESQIDRDIRLTAFENGGPLDFSATSKRQSADRLIDQTMIRAELAKGSYPAPPEAEIARVLEKIKQARFHSTADYEQALKTYGLSDQELRAHVAFEIQVVHFADAKFGNRGNGTFFAWLDGARRASRIQFHEDVLQ